jgi:hypothetical protein
MDAFEGTQNRLKSAENEAVVSISSLLAIKLRLQFKATDFSENFWFNNFASTIS